MVQSETGGAAADARRIVPVILSGGSGTRLWPMSRGERPKQFLSLTAAETMLQLTALRIADETRFAPPIVVANGRHSAEIETQMEAAGAAIGALILEPAARNTAPAIALAALAAPADAILLVMPSDHVIGDQAAFHAAIATAEPLVRAGWLATFGIAPDAPETGYGYIAIGDALVPGVHKVESFVEKPDRATAEAYVAGGRHAWNGGIFLFRADAYLGALKRHAPAIHDAAVRAMDAAERDGARIHPDAAAFAASPDDSIDYAVMEKADRVAVVPVEMAWSDVGSWDALHALAAQDDAGNAHLGEVVAIDSSRCLIRSEGPLVAAVGVSDLIVIATRDAVLITPRGRSQGVKLAVEALKKMGHAALDRFS